MKNKHNPHKLETMEVECDGTEYQLTCNGIEYEHFHGMTLCEHLAIAEKNFNSYEKVTSTEKTT